MRISIDGTFKIISIVCFLVILLQCESKTNNEEVGILKQFPHYHLLDIKDLDPMASKYFSQNYPDKKPGIIKADFNGDSHQEYAILLRKNNSNLTKLVVLLSSELGNHSIIYELDVANNYDTVYLTPVAGGSIISQTEAFDIENNSSPVKLKYTGIRLTYFGKAEIVLYWDENFKRIETIQTAD